MSEKQSEDIWGVVAAIFGVALILAIIGAFFYFTLVYNNNQNIKRDEFYASHCKNVTTSQDLSGSTYYQCGASK